MRKLILIITAVSLAVCHTASADDVTVAKARAKAALDLMQRQRERDAITTAKAKAAAALALACKDRECSEDVQYAVRRAIETGKKLFIWVGFDCKGEPAIRKAFPDAIHCHASEANGDKTQRILAGDPKGRLHRFDRATFDAKTPAVIRQALQTAPAPTVVPQRVSYAATAVRRAANC